jgi:hypothetical protein
MASRLSLMPSPNADGNPPAVEVLKERLRSLVARAKIHLPDP